MKKIILSLLFSVLFISVADATQYYVTTSGNDSNPCSIGSPCLTVQHCANIAGAGDTCNVAAGTYREEITLPTSGSSGNPITFNGAAGSHISGAALGTGWSLSSGSIYDITVGSITQPTQLYVDGNFLDMAHYPASWAWLSTTSASGNNTTIIDSGISSGGGTPLTSLEVVNSTVIARTASYDISQSKATGFSTSTGTITISPSLRFNMPSGYGFYLENMLWMITYAGAWAYDGSTTLYLRTTGSDNPSGHTIEYSARPYGFYDNGKNYITIQGFSVDNANTNDVYVNGANHVIVSGITTNGGLDGINFTSVTTGTIQNNTIVNALKNGIEMASDTSVTLQGNVIQNAGYVGTPKPVLGSIEAYGNTSLTINDNHITNSGYDGIIYSGNGINVTDNVINNSCLVEDDCGGIYTNTGDLQSNVWTSTISGNTVTNSIGNYSGTTLNFTQAQGIYLDDLSNGYTVTNNKVINTDYDLYIHTGYNNTVTGNEFYRARNYGTLISEDSCLCNGGSTLGGCAGGAGTSSCVGVVATNTITGNTLESLGSGYSSGNSQFYGTGVNTYNSRFGSSVYAFGTFNHNTYCHPNTLDVVGTTNGSTTNYTLAAWQTASGQDSTSTDIHGVCAHGDSYNDLAILNITFQ